MKRIILACLICLLPSLAFATNPTSCQASNQQNTYHCTTGDGGTFTVHNAASAEAAAEAIAAQQQGQTQGQGQDQSQGQGQDQSQSSENTNSNVNGGNSVNIDDSDPAHTTHLGANLGINLDIPIGRGIQGASCRENVRLAKEMGWNDVALQIFLECPQVRKLNLKVYPGDKG